MTSIRETIIDGSAGPLFVRHVGDGPLVILCHGFPETGASWTHLMESLATAGFTAVAVDLRGMGRSVVPEASVDYSIFAVVDDVMDIAAALGHATFHIVGADLGAILAWHTALVHPSAVRSVTGISIPYFAPTNTSPFSLVALLRTETETPYILRFAEDDAHLEMERDPRAWIEGCLYSISGSVPADRRLSGMVPRYGPVSDGFVPVGDLDFLTEEVLDEIVACYERTGFEGAMHWYRRIDEDWSRLQRWAGQKIEPPCQFIGGDADPVRLIAQGAIAELSVVARDLRKITILPDVGHWPHLEAPQTVLGLIVDLASES